jgi:hypothetical protein
VSVPTVAEIHERIAATEARDFLGFERGEYIRALPFDEARRYLVPDATPELWSEPLLGERALDEARGYMAFAWGKANDCRGISANRSVMHLVAWLWLAGERALSDEIQREFEDRYCYYGKPILRRICERFGWDWRSLDNGRWCNSESEDGVSADIAWSEVAA